MLQRVCLGFALILFPSLLSAEDQRMGILPIQGTGPLVEALRTATESLPAKLRTAGMTGVSIVGEVETRRLIEASGNSSAAIVQDKVLSQSFGSSNNLAFFLRIVASSESVEFQLYDLRLGALTADYELTDVIESGNFAALASVAMDSLAGRIAGAYETDSSTSGLEAELAACLTAAAAAEALESTLSNAEGELEACQAAREELERQLEQVTTERDDLEAKLTEAEAEIEELRQLAGNAEQLLNDQKAVTEGFRARILELDGIEQRLAQTQNQLDRTRSVANDEPVDPVKLRKALEPSALDSQDAFLSIRGLNPLVWGNKTHPMVYRLTRDERERMYNELTWAPLGEVLVNWLPFGFGSLFAGNFGAWAAMASLDLAAGLALAPWLLTQFAGTGDFIEDATGISSSVFAIGGFVLLGLTRILQTIFIPIQAANWNSKLEIVLGLTTQEAQQASEAFERMDVVDPSALQENEPEPGLKPPAEEATPAPAETEAAPPAPDESTAWLLRQLPAIQLSLVLRF